VNFDRWTNPPPPPPANFVIKSQCTLHRWSSYAATCVTVSTDGAKITKKNWATSVQWYLHGYKFSLCLHPPPPRPLPTLFLDEWNKNRTWIGLSRPLHRSYSISLVDVSVTYEKGMYYMLCYKWSSKSVHGIYNCKFLRINKENSIYSKAYVCKTERRWEAAIIAVCVRWQDDGHGGGGVEPTPTAIINLVFFAFHILYE
jgi:hypothetical protein